MRLYDARDDDCTGVGLGIIRPTAAQVQETAGGEYALQLTIPVAEDTGWELVDLDRQVVALCPVLGEIKPQRFRVYRLSLQDSGKSLDVQARHITYDLQYVVADTGKQEDTKTSAASAGAAIWAAIDGSAYGFTLDVSAARQVRKGWNRCSVTKALLDQSTGLVRQARGRLVRDNKRILLLPGESLDSGITIRHGIDLLGLTTEGDLSECYTRLIPTGQAKDGGTIYLPERYIDSPHVGDYARPRAYTWQVTGARVGGVRKLADGSERSVDENEVYSMLREAAADKLAGGCDLPADTGTVEYIDLGRTEEYPELEGLQLVQLYQSITVVHDPIGLRITKTVSGYTWDVLLQRYDSLTLGDPWRNGDETSFVTTAQAATGGGGVGGGGSAGAAEEADHAHLMFETYDQFVKDQTTYTNSLMIQMDATQGIISTLATSDQLSATNHTINTVQETLDAMNATIALKANSDTLEDALTRLGSAWVEIDGLKSRIDLTATQTELTNLTALVNQAFIDIDGAKADIALKASQEDMIRTHDDIGNLTKRLSQAEIDINGAKADIALRASLTEIDRLRDDLSEIGKRTSKAEVDIDGANALISLKASSEEVGKLGDRMSSAELAIDGANAQISLRVEKDKLNSSISLTGDGVSIKGGVITLDGEVVVKRVDLESLVAAIVDADYIKSGITNTDSLSVGSVLAGKVDADEIVGGPATFSGLTIYGQGTLSEIIAKAAYSKEEVDTKLENLQKAIVKTLEDYAKTDHNHDTAYAAKSHGHAWSEITDHPSFAAINTNTGKILSTVIPDLSGTYAKKNHTHSGYAASDHDHDGVYSKVGHGHSGYAKSDHSHSVDASWNLAAIKHRHTYTSGDSNTGYSLTAGSIKVTGTAK